MIVFDLRCAGAGHVFEAWFGSGDDYESQRARGLVSCPLCGDLDVSKAVVAPRLSNGSGADPQETKAMLARVAAVQRAMLSGSENVGRRFADEARAIHTGDAAPRSIHGQASVDEASALAEEGIAIAALPLPITGAGREN